MTTASNALLRLPGLLASVAIIAFVAFWSYWSAGELYHEGWWGAWTNRLPYLAPTAVVLIPALLAFRWPLVGGAALIALGIFALRFFAGDVAFIGLTIALVGVVFLFDGVVRRRTIPESPDAWRPRPLWRRRWRETLAIAAPVVIYAAVSAAMLPVVLSRVDDADRGERRIHGNGVLLVWAPEGPGWNWRQPWGGYPSWESIALYGVAPIGLDDKPGFAPKGQGYDENGVYATAGDMARSNLCIFLSADGSRLESTPQNVWRMPGTDEVVRSLGRHGEDAGCEWDGELARQVRCDVLPDKESPLWRTDEPVIYLWTADSHSNARGYFVAYNGTVNATYKLGGNPRHGYRCVREP